MYSIFDIYKEILLINKEIDIYVSRHIFSYLMEDYKEIINHFYIKKQSQKYLGTLILNINRNPIFHLSDFPYLITKENLKYKIDNIFKENNKNYIFSHYCCNGKGLMYDHPDNDKRKLLKLNFNFN